MKIYVFGDSHAGSFGVHPDIIATPTGPSSMYLIGKEGDVLFADIIKVLIYSLYFIGGKFDILQCAVG